MPDFYFGDSYPLVLTDTGVVAELPAGTAIAGITVDSVSGLSTSLSGKESVLGNPASDWQVLSSTAAGVRSWITPSSGGGTSGQLPFYKANGALDTISLTVDSKLPFYKSNSVASNIPLVT